MIADGAALRAWRTGLALTQAEAAAAFGLHPVSWSRFETGAEPLPAWLPWACRGYADHGPHAGAGPLRRGKAVMAGATAAGLAPAKRRRRA